MNQNNLQHAQLPPGAMNGLMNLVQSQPQPQPQPGSQNHLQIHPQIQQQQQQQQQAQAAGPAFLPPGWQPQAVPGGNAGAQLGPWPLPTQLLMHLMAQQQGFPAVAAHSPSANEIAAAVAAAMQPLIQEKNAAPVGSAADDEQILVDALKKAKAEGFTPRQALEKLHGVNNHTETGWKNYFLDHYERLHATIYTARTLVEVMASQSTSSASTFRAARFLPQHHESQQEAHASSSKARSLPRTQSFPEKTSTTTQHRLVQERAVQRTEHPARKPISSRRDAGFANRRNPTTSESDSSEHKSSDDDDRDENPDDEDEDSQDRNDDYPPIRPNPRQRQQARPNPSKTTGAPKGKRKPQTRSGPGKRVTEEILRSMAIYMIEKVDNWDSLPYQTRWAEFAARPENSPPNGRSLGAWAQVSRDHAEDLMRHVDEYRCEQSLAKVADERKVTPPQSDGDVDACYVERPSRAMLKRRAESTLLESAETKRVKQEHVQQEHVKQEQVEPVYIVLSD